MIDELLLHDHTKQELTSLLQKPAQALLFVGPAGSGKGSLARALAAGILGKASVAQLQKDPYFIEINTSAGAIGIEAVRDLQKFMSLKTTGSSAVRRVVIVADAQGMSTEAQNAFLKLLEEPPADTVILLTVDHQQHLLPTVNSRLQILQALPPSKADSLKYFGSSNTEAEVERAYLLSDGRTGLMQAILSKDTEHPLAAQIDRAKQIYGQKVFERLAGIDEISKQKDELPGLLSALKRIARKALEQSAAKGQMTAAEQWHRRLNSLHQAEENLQKNANAKLLLTDLFLNL